MTGSIGLGLVLNVLFWTVAVLVVAGLAALAVIEWFPGRETDAGAGAHASRGAARDAEPGKGARDEDGGEGAERYRKAS